MTALVKTAISDTVVNLKKAVKASLKLLSCRRQIRAYSKEKIATI
ncbi:hypothetical protein ScFU93_13310 [Streptococcus canis]|nr:hypothetical protein ScOT1_16240 [Streptococcus canis]GFG42147.1 hypothetical protein ScFU29_10510 [Streptococcus canis]GFG46085.1 hypothetical protein ScFU93_13310 [Streptococcus canis]